MACGMDGLQDRLGCASVGICDYWGGFVSRHACDAVLRSRHPIFVAVGDDDADGAACEWGRLDYREDTEDQVVETGGYSAGTTVTVLPDDDVFYTSGCGMWTKQ